MAPPVCTALLSRSLSIVALVVFAAAPVRAQTPAEPEVVPLLRNVTRVERWSFFEPPAGGGNPDYTLLGNRATLGIRVNARRLDVNGSFQYAQLVGLPRSAFGPGPLGPGPLFFNAAQHTRAYQLYFKSMSLRLKELAPGLSVEVGRMPYESGERTPFAGRLIGNAEWTMFERAFDGARVDYEAAAWRAHASFVMPTQGAYEESASPTIGKVQVSTVSWTRRETLQIFAHTYRDTRPIRARPDNTGARAPAVDIGLRTLGASWVRGCAAGGCALDVRLWAAVQDGDWYGEAHRAGSASAEAAYRWDAAAWRPTLRAGALYASGDDDPNDERHGTFFPMVPTTTPAVLAGTYAQMNLRDLYVAASVEPHPRLSLAAEVHHLSLASRLDRWYSGTGATAFAGTYFGFSSRPSTLATALGTFTQVSAAMPLTPHWRLSMAAGIVRGGDVVRRQFAGRTLTVVGLESAWTFP